MKKPARRSGKKLNPNPQSRTPPMKIRLLKFGSKTCGACVAMSKARTLEKFAEAHPGVTVLALDIADEHGESPALGDYKKHYELSDEYEVTALPTTIMEVEGVGEVVRLEGAVNAKDLAEAYETTVQYAERSKKIPW